MAAVECCASAALYPASASPTVKQEEPTNTGSILISSAVNPAWVTAARTTGGNSRSKRLASNSSALSGMR